MAFEIVKIGTDKYTEVLADAHQTLLFVLKLLAKS